MQTRRKKATVPKRLAFSYRRFSSKKQKEGRSAERQIRRAEKWARRHGLILDTTLTMLDEGLSSFWGDNRMKGHLGKFVALCGTPRVPAGSVLIVEDFDRLSREEPDDAWEFFRQILLTGVEIAVVMMGKWFTKESLNSFEDRVLVQASQHKAHAESKRKSEMGLDVWRARRKRARKGKPQYTMIPTWCKKTKKGQLEFREERVATIREMIRLHEAGFRAEQIAEKLSQEAGRFAYWGRSGIWRASNIHRILTSPSLWGAYQPRKRGANREKVDVGQCLPGIYPAICTEEEAAKIRGRFKGRRGQRGRRSKGGLATLKGVVHDSVTQTSLFIQGGCKLRTGVRQIYLVRLLSGKRNVIIDYWSMERLILRLIQQWKPEEMEPGVKVSGRADTLRKVLQAIEDRRAEIRALLKKPKGGSVADLAAVLDELKEEDESTRQQLEAEEAGSAPARETLTKLQALAVQLENAQEDKKPELRQRLNGLLRELLAGVWVYREELGPKKAAVYVQVWTRGGMCAYEVAMVGKPPAHWEPLDLRGVDFRLGSPLKK